MNAFQDRRVLIGLGAGAAVLAGVAMAVLLAKSGAPAGNTTEGNSTVRGLQVQMGADEAKLDPNRTLRCFVGGKFVGQASLADCAQKNGVSAQALDVGLDQSGELAAASGDTQLQPLPPPDAALANTTAPAPTPPIPEPKPVSSASTAGVGDCLRFSGDGWRDAAGGAVPINACIQALFPARCPKAGEAIYGRWSGQTLRLVPGRVEISSNNRDFHPVAEQNPKDCAIGQVQP
ncbi:MAG: hypothetical protein ABIO39_03595 [Caulobacteraceae bacterium]